MIILAIDSSGRSAGVAVLKDGRILAELSLATGTDLAARLTPAVSQVLDLARVPFADLGAVAATRGPGSFSGLRVGLATAMGISSALDIPAIGVCTLSALACNVAGLWPLVHVALDAKKRQVYAQSFTFFQGLPRGMGPAAALSPREWVEGLGKPGIFLGDGALLYREQIVSAFGEKSLPPSPAFHQIRPSWVARLAAEELGSSKAPKEHTIAAEYLRAADAKLPARPAGVRAAFR